LEPWFDFIIGINGHMIVHAFFVTSVQDCNTNGV
jgi:hypothetical protein